MIELLKSKRFVSYLLTLLASVGLVLHGDLSPDGVQRLVEAVSALAGILIAGESAVRATAPTTPVAPPAPSTPAPVAVITEPPK